MSETLDTRKVWENLIADTTFSAGMPEAARPVFRELVDGLPGALAQHLGKKADVAALMEAKISLLGHIIDSGFVGKLADALPEEAYPFPGADMSALLSEGFAMMRDTLATMIADVPEMLGQAGMDERQMLAHPQGFRFNQASMDAYDAGALTIRGLLETQPAALLVDGNG